MRYVKAALALMALWLLMSGIYEPMIIGFGAASVTLVIWVMARMDKVDGTRAEWQFNLLKFLGFMVWLMVEIAKANWAVTKIILSPKAKLRQHVFSVPVSQKSELGQVTFANAITLTPGTLSIETEKDSFVVHALSFSEADHAALADMAQRISACEKGAR